MPTPPEASCSRSTAARRRLPVYLIHWQAPEWCASAAGSILASQGTPVSLTVIDNGASGGSRLRNLLPEGVDVVELVENEGYAGAANRALAHWREHHPESDFCVIGSHDLHVEHDTLTKLMDVATAQSDVGIVAPAILGPKRIMGGAWDGRRSSLVTEAASSSVVDRDWASGTCLLLRHQCLRDIGGFDHLLGSYAEDVDLGLRARDRGWRVVVVRDAHARGLGTASSRATRLSAANAIVLNLKRRGAIGAFDVSLSTIFGVGRGFIAGVNPRHAHAERRYWRKLATQRLLGLIDVLRSGRLVDAYRARRVDRVSSAPSWAPGSETRPLHIVFLSHEAHRTGAPVLLLRMVRWLTSNTKIRCTVLCAQDGPLVEEFAAMAETLRLPEGTPLLSSVLSKLGLPPAFDFVRGARCRWTCRKLLDADLLYVNSLANGATLDLVDLPGVPAICHVHELESAIRARVTTRDWATLTSRVAHYVAVSDAVRVNLIENRGVSPDRITVVHGFVDAREEVISQLDHARATARATMGVPAEAFVVGGAGRADWLKGADLFVAIAASAMRMAPDALIRFIWVGAIKEVDRKRLDHDERAAHIENCVEFTGFREDAPECFAAFDVLALTSREDAFPLVVLESALIGIPTVCFQGAGGSTEFVRDESGVSVPYLDVQAFAHTLVGLARDRERRETLGARASARATEFHSADRVMPDLLEVIRHVARRGTEPRP